MTGKQNTYALAGKSVLITGANGQLGSAFVEHFLRHGARVYVTDVHDDISPALVEKLKKTNLSEWSYTKMDVTNENSIRALVSTLESLDVLINNAGIAVLTPFEERTAEELDRVLAVNIKGTILCSKVCAEKMEKKGGSIINFGSIYGVVAADMKIYGDSKINSSEIYAATKAGVIHVSRYLAAYLARKNIRVNAVSPGGVFNNQKKVFVDNYVRKTPLGRMASPDDIASTVLFLASPDAGYITGQNITVDGGFTLNQ